MPIALPYLHMLTNFNYLKSLNQYFHKDLKKGLPYNFNKRPYNEKTIYSCKFMELFICNHYQEKNQVSTKNLIV